MQVFNNAPILEDADKYYIGIMRATIPTSGIPKLIVPVLLDGVNRDINKLIYLISLAYRDASGNVIYSKTENVLWESEIVGPPYPQTPPNPLPLLKQDFTTSPYYYYCYDVSTLLKCFNNTIRRMWGQYVYELSNLGVDLSTCEIPYWSVDYTNNKFACNLDYRFFRQDSDISFTPPNTTTVSQHFPRAELYSDGLVLDLLQTPASFINKSNRGNNSNLIILYSCNKNDGESVLNPDTNILTSYAYKSALNQWSALTKIIFTVNYGIPTKLEYENINHTFQSTTPANSIDRPLKPTLTDIIVEKDAFAQNNNFIQFQASGISQIRLIDITTSQNLQNFEVSITWEDNYGNQHNIIPPTGIPVSMKLAFFPKTTTLI